MQLHCDISSDFSAAFQKHIAEIRIHCVYASAKFADHRQINTQVKRLIEKSNKIVKVFDANVLCYFIRLYCSTSKLTVTAVRRNKFICALEFDSVIHFIWHEVRLK